MYIPVHNSEEEVRVALDQLPRDATDIVDILKAEQASLDLWLIIAVRLFVEIFINVQTYCIEFLELNFVFALWFMSVCVELTNCYISCCTVYLHINQCSEMGNSGLEVSMHTHVVLFLWSFRYAYVRLCW